MLFLQSAGIKKEPPRRTALNNIYKDVIALYEKLQKLFDDTTPKQMEYIDERRKEKERPINAVEQIAPSIAALENQVAMLKQELAEEHRRAVASENSIKRYSFYIAVSSGIVSAVVSICMAYLFS